MPDGRTLRDRLAAERDELQTRIHAPELSAIHARARGVRRRRALTSAGTALAVAVLAGVAVVRLTTPDPVDQRPVASASAPPFQSVWRGSGLTLYGLTAQFVDVPGDVYDVQFTDPRHGYALAADCGQGENCQLSVAVSRDGGRTWGTQGSPLERAPRSGTGLPVLVPVGGRVAIVGQSTWTDGPYWQLANLNGPPVDSAGDGGALWVRAGDGCTPGPVYAFRAGGKVARLAHQPPIQACRVAQASGDTWWVGGYVTGAGRRPAVAVTRDGGRSWRATELPGATADAWAQVAPLGADTYASVVSPRGGQPYPETLILHAVHRSAGGGPFLPYGPSAATVVGDVVPLLDGRLVMAGPHWYVSGPGGAIGPAGGSLPFVGRIARTSGGWVAYNLFQAGWAAVSRDGLTWHKINLR